MEECAREKILQRSFFVDPSISLPGGKHSCPLVLSDGIKRFVFKRCSLGKKLSFEEALDLSRALKEYHLKLKENGLNVSKLYITKPIPVDDDTEHYFVGSLEEFVGEKNVLYEIQFGEKEKALEIYFQVLCELYKIVGLKVPSDEINSSVLIDSNPRNFVRGKNGKVYFVDFYVPRLLNSQGKMYPFIKRLHETKQEPETIDFFEKTQKRSQHRGVIFQNLLAQTIAERPELRKEFENLTIQFLGMHKEFETIGYLQLAIMLDYDLEGMVKEETLKKIEKAKPISTAPKEKILLGCCAARFGV